MENNVLRTSNTYREALKQGLREVLQNNEPFFLMEEDYGKITTLKTLVDYILYKTK